METYNWLLCTVSTEYLENNPKVKFGRGWEFVSQPDAPILRQFTLKYDSLCYFTRFDTAGALVADKTREPKLNAWLLQEFYEKHLQHGKFTFPHPVFGDTTCRFKDPLKLPDGMKGANGWLNGFEIILVEAR